MSLKKDLFLGLILGLVALSVLVGILTKRIFLFQTGPKERNLVSSSAPTLTPTITPTPTPTLTPEQTAEIRRKRFEELNQKYGPCKNIPILMYHHVLDSVKAREILASSLNVPPNIFREQMDYLFGRGYVIISLEELLLGLNGSLSLPERPVVLTFDDGYRDFYDNVFPVLKEKSLKATVFIISQFVGGERYMDWWQIREMANSGLVLVGDHTLNHPSLPKISEEEEFDQIVSAKKIIEQYVGKTVNLFAYPYGGTNQQVKEILRKSGFLGAVLNSNMSSQCALLPFELSRIRIGVSSLSRYGL